MAKDPKPLEDLNAQAKRAVEETKQATDRMKQSVEETKEQALGAADTYFDFLNKTISSFPLEGTEFGEKLKSFAEKNNRRHPGIHKAIQSGEGLSGRASHTDRVHADANVRFWEQTKSLAEAFIKTATSEVKVPFKTSLE